MEKKILRAFCAFFVLHWKEVGAESPDDNPTPALSLRLRIQIYVTESLGRSGADESNPLLLDWC